MPAHNTDVIPLVVGLSLCGASAALLYIWFQTKAATSASDDEIDSASTQITDLATSAVRRLSRHLSQTSSASNAAATASDSATNRLLECAIPNHLVPLVEGRSGANVRAISAQTGCTITFRPRSADSQTCEIRGPTFDAIQLAAELVRKETQPPPIVTERLQVPQSQCGVVIGRCGEALQEICRRSMAKVYVEAGGGGEHAGGGGGSSEAMRTIKITGTAAHVQMARTLIEEKIRVEADRRRDEEAKRSETEPRSPRETRTKHANGHANGSIKSSTGSTGDLSDAGSETASASGAAGPVIEAPPPPPSAASSVLMAAGETQLEVYVSAIASPSRFWLQLVGPQSLRLDAMVAEMTEYYQVEANRAAHKIADPYLGQIVAALFKYDGKWYRAEIVGILPNEFNPRNVVLDLYFVDFGDSEYVAPHEVYELRTDFLTLRFQAIECFLAHVKSTNGADEEIWTPDAISRFEEITHVAQWRKMHARMVTTKDRKYGDFARRENSPVPGVELYDSNDINIASMLLNEKFALSDAPPIGGDSASAAPKSPALSRPTTPAVTFAPNITAANRTAEPSAAAHPSETFIELEKRQMLSQSSELDRAS